MIVNRQDLAGAMGVSLPTVDRWIKEGCPVKTRGRKGIAWEFVLGDVIAWWGERERENAAGAETSDVEELKRRKLAAEAGEAELRFARARGEVALIAEFERAQAKLMATIQANIMNVPARAVLQLLGETDERTFKQRLRAELQLALEQAAEADLGLDDDDAEEGEE